MNRLSPRGFFYYFSVQYFPFLCIVKKIPCRGYFGHIPLCCLENKAYICK